MTNFSLLLSFAVALVAGQLSIDPCLFVVCGTLPPKCPAGQEARKDRGECCTTCQTIVCPKSPVCPALKCLYGTKPASPSTGFCCPSCCAAPLCLVPSAGCTRLPGKIGSDGCLGCGVVSCPTTTMTTTTKPTTTLLPVITGVFNPCLTVRCAAATTCPLGQSWRRDPGDCCSSCKVNVCADDLLCRALFESSCSYGYIAADRSKGLCCPSCCAAPLNCPAVPAGCAAVIPKDKNGCVMCPSQISCTTKSTLSINTVSLQLTTAPPLVVSTVQISPCALIFCDPPADCPDGQELRKDANDCCASCKTIKCDASPTCRKLACSHGELKADASNGFCCPRCCETPLCRAVPAGCTTGTAAVDADGCTGCPPITCSSSTLAIPIDPCDFTRCFAPPTKCPLGQELRKDPGECCTTCKQIVCDEEQLCLAPFAACTYGRIDAAPEKGICCDRCCAAPRNCPDVPSGCAAIIPRDANGCQLCPTAISCPATTGGPIGTVNVPNCLLTCPPKPTCAAGEQLSKSEGECCYSCKQLVIVTDPSLTVPQRAAAPSTTATSTRGSACSSTQCARVPDVCSDGFEPRLLSEKDCCVACPPAPVICDRVFCNDVSSCEYVVTAKPAEGRCCDECSAVRPATVGVTTSATTRLNEPTSTTTASTTTTAQTVSETTLEAILVKPTTATPDGALISTGTATSLSVFVALSAVVVVVGTN